MTHPTFHELHRIELEARRMRAEALRSMFVSLGRAVTGLFAHRGARRTA